MPWIRPLLLTLQLMGLSVLFAAAFGITLAFLIDSISCRRWWGRALASYCSFTLIACVATPLILHAAAWEATAGKFGWLTFSQTAARTYTGLAGQYGGLVACVWIHGLIGTALVALSTRFGVSRVDPGIVDQSLLDGGPIWTWWRIRLPIASPWVVTGCIATALLAATEMTVVDLYGVRTLADEFYLFHAVRPSLASILMTLVLPCVLSIALLTTLLLARPRRSDVALFDRRSALSRDAEMNKPLQLAAVALASAIATFMFAFPLAGLLLKTGQQITVSPSANSEATIQWSLRHAVDVLGAAPHEFAREYFWTAILAGITAVICIPVAWSVASVARLRPRLGLSVDLVSLIFFLVPGPVVGLAVVRLFTLPVPGFHTLYHQTVLPTVIALLVRALPVSYWILRAGYAGIDSTILDVSRLDHGWFGRLWNIDRPLLNRPLGIAFVAAMLMASGDVPATLPVLPPGVVTVGTRLFSLLHSGARNQEAALAFWYVGSIVMITIVTSACWKRSGP